MFSSELFCHKNKTLFGLGDILKFPRLAETMETIAKKGADAFYTGKIAKDLIQDVQARSKHCLYTNCSRCNHNRCSASKIILGRCACLQFTFVFTDGTLSLEDLRTFNVRESDACTVQIGDYKMHFPPPPAGGAKLSFILKLMHGLVVNDKKFTMASLPTVLKQLSPINIQHPFVFLRVWALSSLQPWRPENLDFASLPRGG